LRYPKAVLAAALALAALSATFLVRAETRRNVKAKAPAVAARRRILVAERGRWRSREIKHIGDRFRTANRKGSWRMLPMMSGRGQVKLRIVPVPHALQGGDVV